MSIKVEGLKHVYNKGLAYETVAVDNVDFCVNDGEFVSIIGHTGSGKSTLIQHLNGLLKPDSGKIFIGDIDITAEKVTMVDIRKKIGLVFQYPEYQLFEETVYEDIAFGPKNLDLDEAEVDNRIREAMELVGMDFEEYAQRSPFELSGGQKRRIAIAGVIAMKPEVLILDEPTAGLDPKSHQEILEMVCTVKERTGSIIILVSHNMDDVARLSDRVFVMEKGRIVMDGLPKDVFYQKDFLTSIGLGLPQPTEMALMLKEKGMDLGDSILTIDDLESALAEKAGDKS